jgi:hypothetical protein
VVPLREHADLEIELFLQAQARAGGIPKATLEQKVRETLQQIRARVLEETWEEIDPGAE